MLRIAKFLGVIIVAVVLFVACGEALVSQVGGELDKAAKGCEHCEHCESGTEVVDKKDGPKEVGEEDASKDANGEDASEKSDVKEADDSKESSKED
tara:strand:- start:100 stop:387 length:288 start_codon:yes stop_codon:yes gene_type:complete